jgi:hypothetical protein
MQTWNRCASGAWRIVVAGVLAAVLTGCAGTIKQDPRVKGDVSKVQGVTQVTSQVSSKATGQLADNPQFNEEVLLVTMRRRLQDKGLVAPTAAHRVEIVVTDIRVRSSAAAFLLGPFAGSDHVNGVVRLVDANGTPVSSFVIEASYGLGGVAAVDNDRMNWLYDKFSELAVGELEKIVLANRAAATTAATPPATTAR